MLGGAAAAAAAAAAVAAEALGRDGGAPERLEVEEGLAWREGGGWHILSPAAHCEGRIDEATHWAGI